MTPRWKIGAAAGVTLTAVVASLSGCAVARSAGGDFAAGALTTLREADTSLVEMQRRLVDTAFVFLKPEFEDAVLVPARSTWAEMRRGIREEGDSLARMLDQALQRSLAETIPAGMDRSGAELRRQLNEVARSFALEFARAFGEGVSTSVQPAVDSLVANAIRTSVVGLETDLRPSVHALMREVRDSLQLRIGDVDRAVAESQTVSGLRYAMFGGGGLLLVGATLVGIGRWRRRDRALDALIDAIERTGDERTREAAHHCATEAGVGGWLKQRMRHRTGKGGTGSSPPPGREAT